MTIETRTTTIGEWEGTHKPIVVGVDGSQRNHSAVAWAAQEAAALGCAVELVTTLHHRTSRERPGARSADRETLDMLADVRHRVRHIVDEQTVSTVALTGDPVDALLGRAGRARLVVVGQRGLGALARAVAGSTSIALAGRCPVPVAIVPDSWHQQDHRGRPVVLGVDPDRPDHRPTHVAFARARRLGVPLVAVHAHRPPAADDRDTSVQGGNGGTAPGVDRRFAEMVAVWRERFVDVDVRPVHAPTNPAEAVLAAAETAQLVVLGRHDAGVLGGFTLGSVARAVLHAAPCPVIVVPADVADPP